MDIREFTTYNDNAPVTGYGVWIVLDSSGRRAHLLHPVALSEMIVSEFELVKSSGNTVWPVNATGSKFDAERFMNSFKKRIAFFLENKRPFPINTVAKALAGLEEIELDEAMRFIGKLSVDEFGESISRVSNKANREYTLKSGVDISMFYGRPGCILQAFKDHGPASIYQITSKVEGKLQTISDRGRVVTYFVNKFASQGILEIVR